MLVRTGNFHGELTSLPGAYSRCWCDGAIRYAAHDAFPHGSSIFCWKRGDGDAAECENDFGHSCDYLIRTKGTVSVGGVFNQCSPLDDSQEILSGNDVGIT